MDKKSDDGAGCLMIIGGVSVAIGCGYVWGAGIGWLVLGVSCLTISVLATMTRGR